MLRSGIRLEASEVRETGEVSEPPREETRFLTKDIIWKVIALVVVFVLAVIFVMIGMKLAWIGG